MLRFSCVIIFLLFAIVGLAQNPRKPLAYLRNTKYGTVKTLHLNRSYYFAIKGDSIPKKLKLINQHWDSLVFKGNYKIAFNQIDSVKWVNPKNPYRIVIGSAIFCSNIILLQYTEFPYGLIWTLLEFPIAFTMINKVDRVWLTSKEWKLDNQNKMGLPVSN
jgi:hypothetical protein